MREENEGLYSVRISMQSPWGEVLAKRVLMVTPDEDKATARVEDTEAMAREFASMIQPTKADGMNLCFAEVVWHMDSEHSQIEASNAISYEEALKELEP